SRWFNQQRFGNFFKLTPHAHSQKEIQTALSGITLSIDARDWFDVKESVVVPVPVKLPAPVQKLYKQMERDMFVELRSGDVEAMNAAAKTMKCLQIASGAVYLEDGEAWEALHDAKIQALESIIEEAAGAPVLVAYHWRHDLDRLRKAFPQGKTLDTDPATLRNWNAGKI
ncbi:UNVERIFIED_CONTAM: ATP-dependent helicase, partial [Kocuria sp. CPCC 205274]